MAAKAGTLRDPRVVVLPAAERRRCSRAGGPRRGVVGRATENRIELPHHLATRRLLDQLERLGAAALIAPGECAIASRDDSRVVDDRDPVEHGGLPRLPSLGEGPSEEVVALVIRAVAQRCPGRRIPTGRVEMPGHDIPHGSLLHLGCRILVAKATKRMEGGGPQLELDRTVGRDAEKRSGGLRAAALAQRLRGALPRAEVIGRIPQR